MRADSGSWVNKSGRVTWVMGQQIWMGHVSTNLDGSRGSRVNKSGWVTWVMGQQIWIGHVGHGSTNLDGSRGSWVSTCDPLTRDPLTDD